MSASRSASCTRRRTMPMIRSRPRSTLPGPVRAGSFVGVAAPSKEGGSPLLPRLGWIGSCCAPVRFGAGGGETSIPAGYLQ